ncbi:MAG: ubiquinol-cytochrome C chaperone family protein [Alphaproteobacteria bacterium]
MGMLSRIFGKARPQVRDATRLYERLMAQSRQPEFYGEGNMPDSYDGRVEVLTLHMSFVMKALSTHGESGKRLSQALFDTMVDDFDIALREEGLTDSGVKRRIKPIVSLFYARLRAFTDSQDVNALQEAISKGHAKKIETESLDTFSYKLAQYASTYDVHLSGQTLADLAQAKFKFPEF